MLVKDIMNKNVATIEPSATLGQAAKKMVENNTKFLIVTEKEKLVGIATEWDFVKKLASKPEGIGGVKIESVMIKKVIVIPPDTEVNEAAEIMTANNIKRLPIVSNNVLIGVVTAMEIMAAEPKLVEQISELFLTSDKQKNVAG